MRRVQAWLAVAVLVLFGFTAAGEPTADRSEIDGLLGRIEHSACRFMRNGSDYSGAEAAKHLRAKWQVVESRSHRVLTAEQFIDQVASVSSLSGRAYEIDCHSDGQGALSAWLYEVLKALRNPPSQH